MANLMTSNSLVILTSIQRENMLDEIDNVISTLFQRQGTVASKAFSLNRG